MEQLTAVTEYERLVRSIAGKYSFNGSDYDDLYQVGMIGLMKATENFSSDYDTKFSTYAHTYITGEVLKYVRENRVIKVNKDLIKLNRAISNAREVMTQKLMRIPTNSELAMMLDIEENSIIEAESATEYVKSLDYELNDEGKGMDLYDSVAYEENGYSDSILDVRRAVSELPEEERKIVELKFYQDRSQQEIADTLGTNQVGVSRKLTKVLGSLHDKIVA